MDLTIGTVKKSMATSGLKKGQGPDIEETDLVRWRRVDLKAVTEDRFGVVYDERAVSRPIHELGFSHINTRHYHLAQKGTVPASIGSSRLM